MANHTDYMFLGRVSLRAVSAASLAFVYIYNPQSSHADQLSCSNEKARSLVIEARKEAIAQNPLVGAMFDMGASTFSLEAIRTEGNDGFKLTCTGKLVARLVMKDVPLGREPTAAGFARVLQQSGQAGNDVGYTVQNTDDGQIYVQLMK